MLLTLEPGGDIAALVRDAGMQNAGVRSAGGRDAGGASLVVAIAASLDPLAMAQARAAIGPLAIELAPDRRVNAVCPAIDADPADIAAAVAFLELARSTTGQLLDIA